MLKPSASSPHSGQGSFFDPEYVCDRIIPEDSFYRRFKEKINPLIKDKMFASMYCLDNGRPPISPALLAKATILQFHRNLSDREMERACAFDIEIKFALGLRLDERPFDHSSLGDFRKRLLEHEKEKEVFDKLLDKLVKEGLIGRNEIQRIDATHVIADIALPTMTVLVKKGVRNVLIPLKKKHPKLYQSLGKKITVEEYDHRKVDHEVDGRLDFAAKEKKLVEVVTDARTVLRKAESVKGDKNLSKSVEMLKRILREHITEDENNQPKEKVRKEKPADLLVSPVDPDARFGAKSKTKKFHGYKANITETVNSRFITSVQATPGNKRDGSVTVQSIEEQKPHRLKPEKLIGDTAYSDGGYRKALKEHGTELVAPLRIMNNITRAVYPKSMFDYDAKKNTLTCPAGVTIKQSFHDYQKDVRMFHFPLTKCGPCEHLSKCTKAKEKRRVVGIGPAHQELRDAEVYNKTDQFKEDMKLRQAIEGKLSEMKRYHGLTRARYRGLNKMKLQCYFTAVAVNIKRWIKLEMEKLKVQSDPAPT
ncbi:MAG: IS1182 family transposase [Candidatus Nitronauta litoralis]|uniref:IS1182 family transposase n=1 Tax=Candidatus Nitronauta litoralis TaxID=2705533 RepID=A0A7T0G053_9BACT|nr:MAG: IS1182 family transposase [Candidatus Nitronauta litoralis]QPJ62210.1 MAG: IS1182 family transposase [Candidatus Nitronauta litoralis]